MVTHRISLLIVLLLGTFLFQEQLFAQEVVATDGEYYQNSQGSLSWTLGEVAIETLNDGSNILTQGFQQNYETILSNPELSHFDEYQVFPNPFNNYFMLGGLQPKEIVQMQLSDNQGRLITKARITANELGEIKIKTAAFSEGIYFVELNILKTNQRISQRLIKTNYE